MEDQERDKQKWWKRLKKRYQFVVLSEKTFEPKSAVSSSLWGFLFTVIGVLTAVALLVVLLFVFTPLKQFLPGYGDVDMKRDLIALSKEFEEVSERIVPLTMKLDDLSNILSGEEGEPLSGNFKVKEDPKAKLLPDSLRAKVRHESKGGGALLVGDGGSTEGGNYNSNIVLRNVPLADLVMISPVKGGILSDTFNLDAKHYGIDLVVRKDGAPVLAVADGTVISANWDFGGGHSIVIQHENNLMSIYKHNSVLLKKVGSFVTEGDAIALVGNSGHLTTGPHLHLELWYNGFPVNPLNYINLNE